MEKTHPLFHKLKSVVGYSIAIVVIVAALGVSGLRFILTTANLYQEEVEELASSLLEQPVKIGRMDARLSGLVPTIIFHNVELLSKTTKKSLFSLSRIDIGLSVEDLVLRQKITPAQLTIRGVNLHVTRTVEGNYKVKGVDLDALSKNEKSESNSLLERWLLQQGEIGLEDSTFTWKDEQNAGLTWFFEDVNFLLKSTAERYQLLLSGKLPNKLGNKVKLAVDLVGDILEPETWDVKSFIESKKVNLKPLQKYIKFSKFELLEGAGDVKLWLDWNNNNLKKLSGDIKLYNFLYLTDKNKGVDLKYVSGVFDSYRDENNLWNVSVDKFNYGSEKLVDESKFSLAFKYNNKAIETFYVKANYIKLDEISKIITDNHILNSDIEEYINHLSIQGDLRNVYMAWKNNQLHKFNADFNHIGVNAWKNVPNIKSLSGNIVYEQNRGIISLLSEKAIVGFPVLFRNDFKLENFSANILFSNTQEGILFDINELVTKNSEVDAMTSAKLWLPKNDASPYLDFQTQVLSGDISKTSHYLPVSIMSKSLVKWLDEALLGGKVEQGTVIFNGKLRDFPFKNKEGVFSVNVITSDLIMNYQNGWPKITKAKADGFFTSQGMKVHLISGESGDNVIHDLSAEIMAFKKAELELSFSASGSAYSAMQYLVNTPIIPNAKKVVNSMRLMGEVDTKIKVNLPLNAKLRKKKEFSYLGTAKLKGVSLFMLDDKLDIKNCSGDIFFTDKSIDSKGLIANIIDEKTRLSFSSSTKTKSLKISAKGKLKPAVILKRFDIPGANKISGETSFTASMIFPFKSNKSKRTEFILKSDLLGVKSELPDEFNKRKNAKNAFIFTTTFRGEDEFHLGIEFGNRSSAILELNKSKGKVYLNKGAISVSSKKAVLPSKRILYVDGTIDKLTPSKWNSSLELNKTKGTSAFFRRPIVINLDKLNIVRDDEKNDEEKVIASNPKNVPPFEGVIKNLYFDKLSLGRLDFKASKKRNGIHFDEIILTEKNMKLFSNGDWNYDNGKHHTNMNITLSSDDFGSMLTGLGFAAVIEKGLAETIGKVSWKGSPTQFDFKNLNGNIQLKIKNGNIIEAEAGAGRLLGLFSLSALPRKLFGDFSDTFKSGFNFDAASGEVNIDLGDAYTEDFLIRSPVAEVTISGRTGLAARDYDNRIEVIPELGGGLAGMTALLVNLPAGIGLWLINKLTGEKINKASTRIYEVSGSWDKPIIEQTDGAE